MPDSPTLLPRTPKRVGVAADHGGFELKEYLGRMLREADYEVVDFGDSQPKQDDDYPDFVVPLGPFSFSRRSGSRCGNLRWWRGCVRCRQQGAGRAGLPDP